MLTTEEDQLDETKSRRLAEEMMEKMTEEHLEGNEAEPEATPTSTEVEPEGGEASETPPEGGEAAPAKEKAIPPAVTKEVAEPEKVDAPPGEVPPAPPVDPLAEDEVIKQINAVNLRDTAHPKTKKALKVVKDIAAHERRERISAEKTVQERADEIAHLKALKLLDEPTEKELSELRAFKRTVDRKHDPEFNRKYVDGEKALETQSMQVLTRNGVPETTAKFIEEHGGVLKFRVSQKLMPLVNDMRGNPIARHPDGTPYTQAEFFQKDVFEHMSPKDKDVLQGLAMRSAGLEMDRDQELGQSEQETEAIFKQRQEQEAARAKDWSEKFQAAAQKVVDEFGDVAKKKPVPANATAEEKAAIDKANAVVDKAEGIAKRYGKEWTPENVARMVVTLAYHETAFKDRNASMEREIAQLKKDVADKDEKLIKFKASGRVSNGAAPQANRAAPAAPKNEDPEAFMERQMAAYMTEQGR